jgi:hypothetical protein
MKTRLLLHPVSHKLTDACLMTVLRTEQEKPPICLPRGWSRRRDRDGNWKYRGERLPLGWTLRYLPNGSPCFHNGLRHFSTRDDPRDDPLIHGLDALPTSQAEQISSLPLRPRRSATQHRGDRPTPRSSTIPLTYEEFVQFEHTSLKTPSSIRLLKWLGREDSGMPAFEIHQFEINSAPPYVAL